MLWPILIVAFYFGNLIRCLICVHVFIFSNVSFVLCSYPRCVRLCLCCIVYTIHSLPKWAFGSHSAEFDARCGLFGHALPWYIRTKQMKFPFDVNECFMLTSDRHTYSLAFFYSVLSFFFSRSSHSIWPIQPTFFGLLWCFVCIFCANTNAVFFTVLNCYWTSFSQIMIPNNMYNAHI